MSDLNQALLYVSNSRETIELHLIERGMAHLFDEVMSTCYESVIDSISKYESDRGPLSQWVFFKFRTSIRRVMSKRVNLYTHYDVTDIDVRDFITCDDDEVLQLGNDAFVDVVMYKIDSIYHSLTDDGKLYFQLINNYKTYAEVCVATDKSLQDVKNGVFRLKHKIRKIILTDLFRVNVSQLDYTTSKYAHLHKSTIRNKVVADSILEEYIKRLN